MIWLIAFAAFVLGFVVGSLCGSVGMFWLITRSVLDAVKDEAVKPDTREAYTQSGMKTMAEWGAKPEWVDRREGRGGN